MAKVEEDAKTMNLANELYSDMVSLKRKDQLIRDGQTEAGNIDMSKISSAIVASPIPTMATKNFVSEHFLIFLNY